jgi:hypothetical protein
METLDSILFWLEVVLVPTSLGLLIAARGRLAQRWPRLRILAMVLTAATALTVAQPFGVRDESILAAGTDGSAQQPWAGGESVEPTGTQTADLLGLPILHFQLYRRETFDPLAGLGECCPPTHNLKIRSWVPPALMTNGTKVFGLCGDSPCWDPDDPRTKGVVRLIDKDGTWYTVIKSHGVAYAWRLSGGVVSFSGVLYWLLALLGIGGLVRRQARL